MKSCNHSYTHTLFIALFFHFQPTASLRFARILFYLNNTLCFLIGSSQTQKGQEDPQIIHKCLAMLVQLLQSPDINSLNSTLLTILDEFVKPCVGRMDFEIRNMALKAVGKKHALKI